MPTFNQRDSDGGYYIRARPPEAGIITYQVGSEADPIVESYGLRPDDEISWDVIQTLKLLGQISTDGSGVLEVDDFKPDPDQLQETALSEEQARELLATIQEYRDLTQEELATICSILGIDPPTTDIDRIANFIQEPFESLVKSDAFPISDTLEETSEKTMFTSTTVRDENKQISLSFRIASDVPGDPYVAEEEVVEHRVSISREEGILEWKTLVSCDRTWTVKSEVYRQMGGLLPVVVDALDDTEINLGSPERDLEPILESYSS